MLMLHACILRDTGNKCCNVRSFNITPALPPRGHKEALHTPLCVWGLWRHIKSQAPVQKKKRHKKGRRDKFLPCIILLITIFIFFLPLCQAFSHISCLQVNTRGWNLKFRFREITYYPCRSPSLLKTKMKFYLRFFLRFLKFCMSPCLVHGHFLYIYVFISAMFQCLWSKKPCHVVLMGGYFIIMFTSAVNIYNITCGTRGKIYLHFSIYLLVLTPLHAIRCTPLCAYITHIYCHSLCHYVYVSWFLYRNLYNILCSS